MTSPIPLHIFKTNLESNALRHFLLHFEETNAKAKTCYGVDFWPQKLLYNDINRAVLEGNISLGGYKIHLGKIEYDKTSNTFMRVAFSATTTKSRRLMGIMKTISPQPVIDDLIDFLNHCETTQRII
ncbi:MAG: hypothetical protein NC453_11540 [Muribaculum sp.]|nr:hypothetical protein [Muribaculum sp.]